MPNRRTLLLLGKAAPFRLNFGCDPQARAASENGASSNGAGAEPEYDYDLFTIGAGSGGTRASRLSASVYGAHQTWLMSCLACDVTRPQRS